jgi:hypothetical protein
MCVILVNPGQTRGHSLCFLSSRRNSRDSPHVRPYFSHLIPYSSRPAQRDGSCMFLRLIPRANTWVRPYIIGCRRPEVGGPTYDAWHTPYSLLLTPHPLHLTSHSDTNSKWCGLLSVAPVCSRCGAMLTICAATADRLILTISPLSRVAFTSPSMARQVG